MMIVPLRRCKGSVYRAGALSNTAAIWQNTLIVDNDDANALNDVTAAGGGTGDPAEIVRDFIRTLTQRYRAAGATGSAAALDTGTTELRLAELMLAEAAMRYAPGSRPLQLAVLGPTQTGKSTIVNLILGAHVAEVSPLAGFTIHPQGFWSGTGEQDERWAEELLPGWQRCAASELSRDVSKLDRFALESSAQSARSSEGLPACVVWDTPDFDSLAAQTYQRGVLEVAALADAHVFVLSKEKYSDLSVWRMLQLLSPLGRPLIICLNKITRGAAEPIVASLRQRMGEAGWGASETPIVTFGYQPGLDAPVDEQDTAGAEPGRYESSSEVEPGRYGVVPAVVDLRGRIGERLQRAREIDRSAGLRVFVREHWSEWTAPVEVELAALQQWQERVAAALDEAAESYRRDFLEHPQRFDTFRRATVELLHLLELPGFADVLGQVRQVLSWPARRLFAARQAWALRRRKQGSVPHGLGSEEVVLYEMIEKLLTSLERDAARCCDPATPGCAVWRALTKRLEQQAGHLRESFESAARAQRDEFAPVIHATANRLYETLKEKPVMLNMLRTARATTDVAGIALAIKTAGLGINDLLFAPAMFALTSMLTEGTLGSYMAHIAGDLKKQQLEHVRARLLDGVFAKELQGVTASLKGAGLFGISAEQLIAASKALDSWEQSGDE
jgi:hypothetical protein